MVWDLLLLVATSKSNHEGAFCEYVEVVQLLGQSPLNGLWQEVKSSQSLADEHWSADRGMER
jgi:hypothetical protein